MPAVRYTAVHVRELLDLSRTEVQRWLGALPPLCDAPTKARSARQFSIRDLVFLSALRHLHRTLDLPLRTLAGFSGELHAFFEGESTIRRRSQALFLNCDDQGRWHVDSAQAGQLSVCLQTAPIWESVYRFIGLEDTESQQELPLGPVVIREPIERKVRHG